MCAGSSDADARARHPRVLALDCALGGCVVAAGDPDGVIVHDTVLTEREQAARLMPLVGDVLARAGLRYGDLGLIVTTVGPGSFTGLRIGLSAARALGLALGIPVQGVSTIEAMRASCARPGDEGGQFVVIDAKRSDFYAGAFDAGGGPVLPPRCLTVPEIMAAADGGGYVLTGDAAGRLGQADPGLCALFTEVRERKTLDPSVLLSMGAAAYRNGCKMEPEPVYLRGADVSFTKKKQRTIDGA